MQRPGPQQHDHHSARSQRATPAGHVAEGEAIYGAGNQALLALAQAGTVVLPPALRGNQALQRMAAPAPPAWARPGTLTLARLSSRQRAVTVQRHSSWEHRMLGDTDPRKLAMMGAAQDAFGPGMIVGNDDTGYQTITRSHIQHALEEEIGRLEAFRTSDLFRDRQLSAETAAAAEAQIRQWGMVPVRVPTLGGGFEVLSYGEMNTMADLFGSMDDMKKHDPENLHKLVQGVRQQSLHNVVGVYERFTGQKQKRKDFKGAIGSKGETAVPGQGMLGPGARGELALMGKLPGGKKEATGGDEEKSYTGGLARNACHFAPESWHAWADHHQKAQALATQAFTKKQEAIALRAQAAADAASADGFNGLARQADLKAEELTNEAMLTNGFGDHFLQDSFAAGHLINKTEIMKWYVTWLDANPLFAEGSVTAKGVNSTRRVPSEAAVWGPAQAMTGQKGLGVGTGRYDTATVGTVKPNDPQSVENMEGDWEGRFKALGLKAPASVLNGTSKKFLVWWQRQVIANRSNATLTMNSKQVTKAAAGCGLSEPQVLTSLTNLLGDSVAVHESKDKYTLREVWLPGKSQEEQRAFADATRESADPAQQAAAAAMYQRAAERATLKDFHQFLNSAMLQAATNILHDIFCKSGLTVLSAAETLPYKIYGDDAMLGAESSKGVEISAITSNMSRDNILQIAATGREKHAITAISSRFPNSVQVDVRGSKQTLTLENWHAGGVLKNFCETKVFPEGTNTMKSYAASGITSSTTGRGADERLNELTSKVSKDALKPSEHSGEAF